MKNNLITKIALGIAVAALVFSIVTLIRSITIGSGVLLSAILVVGTTVIVAICAVMLYVFNNYTFDEEDGEDDPDESADEQTEEQGQDKTPEHQDEDIETEVDSLIADLESDASYDLSNFE